MTAKELKTLREKAGISQQKLAEKLECSLSAVTKWEAGQPISRIAEIAILTILKKGGKQ